MKIALIFVLIFLSISYSQYYKYNDFYDRMEKIWRDNKSGASRNHQKLFFSKTLNDSVITIPDGNFEQALREALNKPEGDITVSDMETITYLNAVDKNIENLSGIEYAVNLVVLEMNNNHINDLSPISGLEKLEILEIENNKLTDLSPVAALSSLMHFAFSHNEISDLTPLSNQKSFISLRMAYNNISDISPLNGLLSLDYIAMFNNNISDVSPLSSCVSLKTILMSNNQVTDISSFNKLINLEYINADNNQISDITVLTNMPLLKEIYFINNQISSIEALRELTLLSNIYLSENQIHDLSPLNNSTELIHCHLSHNQIQDISPLAGNTKMENLFFNTNQISDISILSNMSQLKFLDLGLNQITDITPCQNLYHLEMLLLQVNQIFDIQPLAGLVNLTELWLENNRLSDEDLPNLYSLDNIQPHWAWDYTELYLDLRNNLGFTEPAIRALADELTNISYEQILWEPLMPRFTKSPGIVSLSENSAVIQWTIDYPTECYLSYSADEINWTTIMSITNDKINHKAELIDLLPATEYVYKIDLYRNNTLIFSTDLNNFETLAKRVEKKIQVVGKPKILNRDDESITIEFNSDEPIVGLCRLSHDSLETVTLREEIKDVQHVFTFSSLMPSHDYYYQVGVYYSNTGEEYFLPAEYSVRTMDEPDRESPIIINGPLVTPDSSFALISFKTNEGAQATIFLYDSENSLIIDSSSIKEFKKDHQFLFYDLLPGRTYDFAIVLYDQAGNQYEWSKMEEQKFKIPSLWTNKDIFHSRELLACGGSGGFTTTTQSDTTGPLFVIKPKLLAAYDSSAVLRWQTDEQSRSKIWVFDGDGDLIFFIESQDYHFQHNSFILRLEPSKNYEVEVLCLDIAGNKSDYEKISFVTRKDDSPVQAKITSPIEIFSTEEYSLVVWGTDYPGDSRAFASLFPSLDIHKKVYYESDISTEHLVILDNLEKDTMYYYLLHSYDFKENEIFSSGDVDSFSTAFSEEENDSLYFESYPDTLFCSSHMMKLQWNTNLLSYSTLIYYPADNEEQVTAVSNVNLVKEHSVIVLSLLPDKEYIFELSCGTINRNEINHTFYFQTKDSLYYDYESPSDIDSICALLDLDAYNVSIQWGICSSPDFSYYRLYRKDVIADTVMTLADRLTENEYRDDFIIENRIFLYGVSAFDYFGNESSICWSSQVTGIEREYLNSKNGFLVSKNFPNPFLRETSFQIISDNTEMVTVRIYNIIGKLILEKKLNVFNGNPAQVDINMKNFSSGVYFYKIDGEKNIISKGKMLLIK